MTFKNEECGYPKMGGEGWNEPWTGSTPELKEKEGISGEISHRETRMDKGKDVME